MNDDENNRFIGCAIPLTFEEFGAPMTVHEFCQLWRERGGSEEHLQSILANMRASENDPSTRSQLLH